MGPRVKLADISKVAGVGVATVSRALSAEAHPDVSAETRERIQKIADELGYRASATARALRNGGYRTLSVVLPDDTWGWWEPVVRSAFRAAAEEGYQLLIHPIAGMAGGASSVIASLANVPTEGVLVLGMAADVDAKEAAQKLHLPIVAIDDADPTLLVPTISSANRSGARSAVEHLIQSGCKNIAVVTTGEDVVFSKDRLQGYYDALEACGIPRDDRLVIRLAGLLEDSSICPEFDDFVAGSPGVDGIFCVADFVAAPVYRSLRAARLNVPEDVLVIGYDDERVAQLLDPPLSSVRQPYETMGLRAVQLLRRAIAGEKLVVERHELQPSLIIRSSSTRQKVAV